MNVPGIINRRVVLILLSLFCFTGLAVMALNSELSSQVVVADANDVAIVSSSGGDVNFTLMGFSSVPLVLNISSPLNPVLLQDVQPLGESIPFGAYLGLQIPAELYAAGANAVTEITLLQTL